MAIEKLALATLSGPLDKFDLAIQTFVINREFHLEDAVTHLRGVKALFPFDQENPYTALLADCQALAERYGIALRFKQFEADNMSAGETVKYLEALRAKLEALQAEQNGLNLTASDNQQIMETLSHIRNVDNELHNFLEMKSVKFRFGRIPRNIYDESSRRIDARQDAFYIHTSIERDYVYGMYFALPSARGQVDAFFAALKFERIWISDKVHGTPEEAMDRLKAEMAEATNKAKQTGTEIASLKKAEEDRFLTYYSYLRFMCDSFDLRGYAGHTADTFYIVGWLPLSQAKGYASEAESVSGFSCLLAEADDIPDASPPTKQKLNLFSRFYLPMVEMYGLPSYREVDPSFFITVTYSFLFGIMFGDVGQGVLLVLAGWLMYKFKGMWIGRVVSCCGVSAVLFGFVYGNIFGFEHLLPGFKVMEDGNVMRILMISAVIGAALIVACIGMNIINGIKQRDLGKILFSANGVAGLVFYLSIAAGLVCMFLLDMNLFTTPYILCLIVLPLLLILFHEPLSKLIRKEKNWLPESIGGFLLEGFFELFEVVLSFLSNTISFLRVGAFAVSHAGMMLVVFLLAETSGGGYNPIVLVVGNLFVAALEAFLVCIQLLRLEYYEMLSRFYGGDGKKFEPRVVDYELISND